MTLPESSPHWELSLADILIAVKRKWIAILFLALTTGGMAALFEQTSRDVQYSATTSVAPYGRATHWAATLGVSKGETLEVSSVAVELEVLVSSQFAKKLAERLFDHPSLFDASPAARAELTQIGKARTEDPTVLQQHLNAFLRTGAHIFDIEARADHPDTAALIANVAAQAYIDDRAHVSDLLIAQLNSQIAADILILNDRLAALEEEPVVRIQDFGIVSEWRTPLSAFQAGLMPYMEFREIILGDLVRRDNMSTTDPANTDQLSLSLAAVREVLQSYVQALPLILPNASKGGWLVSAAVSENSKRISHEAGTDFIIVATLAGMIAGLCIVLFNYIRMPLILTFDQQIDFPSLPAFGHLALSPHDASSNDAFKELRSTLLLRFSEANSHCVLLSASNVTGDKLHELGMNLGRSFTTIERSVLILSCLPSSCDATQNANLFVSIDAGTLPPKGEIQNILSDTAYLSRGSDPRDPLDMFATPQFDAFIQTARAQYDLVLILAPGNEPGKTATLADALLCKQADIALVVTERAKTTFADLAYTHEMLGRAKPAYLGSVMLG